MREMYIATHGRYAEGIISALNLLVGDDHGVTPICAYCGEIGSTAELAVRFEAIAQPGKRAGAVYRYARRERQQHRRTDAGQIPACSCY